MNKEDLENFKALLFGDIKLPELSPEEIDKLIDKIMELKEMEE